MSFQATAGTIRKGAERLLPAIALCLLPGFNFAQIPGGTYTIGGTSPNYTDFSAAIADLNTNGLVGNGPVVFNARSGTYTEQVVLSQVTNASLSNTITFQSESGDSNDVILTYGSATFTDNYTLKLDGADYITIRNMTVSATNSSNNRVVVLTNGAKFNGFISNKLMTISGSNGDEVVYSGNASSNDDDNLFERNWILNGSKGLYFEGTSGARKKRVAIKNNLFETYRYSIYMRYTQDVEISGNRMINASVSNTASTQGVYCFACDSMLTIEKNAIVMMDGTNNYGIELLNCSTPYGGYRGIIANNMITVGGTGTSQGIYTNATTNKDFFHNSILTTGNNNTSSVAFYFNGPSSGTPSLNANFVIRNNVFMAEYGYAIINSVGGIIGSDHNDYNSTGAVSGGRGQLGEWDVNAINNLTELRAASGDDTNSVRVDPQFLSSTDLHLNTGSPLISAGEFLSAVPDDIDDETRDASPDIGADEFGCLPLIVFIGVDVAICAGDSITLDAGAGYASYIWSSSDTTQAITVLATGTYSVTVTDTAACSGSDAINVTVETPPIANTTPAGLLSLCDGDSVQLFSDTVSGNSWLYNGAPAGNTSQSIYAGDSGNYQVVVSTGAGCSDTSAAVLITLVPSPAIFTGALVIDSSSCGESDGNVLGISVSGGTPAYTFTWINSLADTVGGDSADLSGVPADAYTLSVSDANGCSSLSGSYAVNDLGAPPAPVAASPSPYCSGEAISDLSATGTGDTLFWFSDPQLTDTVGSGSSLTPPTTASDTFYVAEGAACTGPAMQVVIMVNPTPVANITALGTTTFCAGDSVALQSDPEVGYEWLLNGTSTGLVYQGITVSAGGDYQVVVSNIYGCSDTSAPETVTVTSVSTISVTQDTGICPGESAILTATGGTAYQWSTGSSAATIVVSPAITATFLVTVSDTACSLSVSDSVTVTVFPMAIVIIPDDSLFIISGNSVNLAASGGLSYVWFPVTGLDDPGSATPVASPAATTVYTVTGTDENGCTGTDGVVVVVDEGSGSGGTVLFVPNFITPNGDNENDVVYVEGSGILSLTFVIYDRWGEKIFETEGWGSSFAWDGTYQGKEMDAQVLVYYVIGEFTNNEKISETGNITLFR